jgi:phage tail sheath protein FI
MATYNSPGSYVIEKDFSEYPPAIGASLPGVVGFAAQGKANKATLITSAAQLLRTFGRPDQTTGGQALQSALEILTRTNALYFVRCTTDAALDASAAIQWGTCPAVSVSGISPSGTYTFRVDSTDEAGVNNNPGGATDYIFTVAPQTVAENPGYGGASAVIDAVNLLQDDTWPWTVVQRDASTVHFVGTHAGSGTSINVSAHGFHAVGGRAWLPTNPIMPLDWSAGATNSISEAAAALSATAPAEAGTAGKSGYGSTIMPKSPGGIYSVQSMFQGAGYNYSSVTKAGVTSTYGNHVKVVSEIDGKFSLQVFKDGSLEESFPMEMTKGSGTELWPEEVINVGIENTTSEHVKAQFGSVGASAGDSVGENWTPALYWSSTEVPLNGGTYSVQGFAANSAPHTTLASEPIKASYIKAIDGTYLMAGGANGDIGDADGNINADVKAALQGNLAQKTGMQALAAEDIDISMACVPGITQQDIQNSLISLAESTQKFLAVVSPPEGFTTAQQAVNWHNGKATTRTASINSSYAAIYWPWIKIFDTFSKSDMYVDPAAFAISVMCTTDIVADPWFAPAGLTRGRLTRPTDVEVSLTTGDRDSLYKTGSNINPIAKFAQDGIVIWGQKTAQRNPSALDRVNIRRMMIAIRKMILSATRALVFEPNDTMTWSRITNLLNPALADIQNRRGISEFRVVCDDTVNTPVRVDRNELWCKVLIRPTKTAEVLIFEVNLTNQSSDLGTA